MADSDVIFDYVTTNSTRFKDRVNFLMYTQAMVVVNEPTDTPKHGKRMDLAGLAMSGDIKPKEIALAVASQAGVQTPILADPQEDPTDAQIETALADIWTDFAKAVA
jgi:hypothetical protein